ncbi:MAG: (2Fe-2S)-binding protein [Deltaproteobacteria bacterium]|nr:(2Fe-2S)-binding protein [Deltaproteobacteria bacterium]
MSDIKEKTDGLVSLVIDGQPVQAKEDWTVLETARHHHIHIPTLCYHEAVQANGGCRLCVVEAKEGNWSKIVVSCLYPVKEGLQISTSTAKVNNVRRWILEMLLAECPASKEIRALAEAYGVNSTRFKIDRPTEQCLLCGLCVRVCEEVVGVRAISFGSRGVNKQVTTPYMVPNNACVACGSCVTVCPTGAMQARLNMVRGNVSERTGHGHAH